MATPTAAVSAFSAFQPGSAAGSNAAKRLGILLPDQLRGHIERLLGGRHVAGLIGFAGLIHGVENVVGGKGRHRRRQKRHRRNHHP